MACGGPAAKSQGSDGNVDVNLGQALLVAPGADSVEVAVSKAGVPVAGSPFIFTQTLSPTITVKPTLNLAPDAVPYDITVTAKNGAAVVATGVGQVVVPAAGAVLVTIKVANGPVATDAPSRLHHHLVLDRTAPPHRELRGERLSQLPCCTTGPCRRRAAWAAPG
jgi:hypothetical protein